MTTTERLAIADQLTSALDRIYGVTDEIAWTYSRTHLYDASRCTRRLIREAIVALDLIDETARINRRADRKGGDDTSDHTANANANE